MSRSAELPSVGRTDEGGPLGRWHCEHRSGGVLAVPHGSTAVREASDLNALDLIHRVARLPPHKSCQLIHHVSSLSLHRLSQLRDDGQAHLFIESLTLEQVVHVTKLAYVVLVVHQVTADGVLLVGDIE